MDPNVLQSLIGNLSHGFMGAATISDFQKSLQLPDDGTCTITAVSADGHEHVIKVSGDDSLTGEGQNDLGFHAVYLLSNQIYFGRMTITHENKFVKLSDAYYLLPGTGGKRDLRLLKVGRELHAPMGGMTFNMAYVIMWQPLRDDGPLVRALMAAS